MSEFNASAVPEEHFYEWPALSICTWVLIILAALTEFKLPLEKLSADGIS